MNKFDTCPYSTVQVQRILWMRSNAFECKCNRVWTQTRVPNIVWSIGFALEHVCIRLRLPLHATMFGFACEHDRNAFEVYIAPGRYCRLCILGVTWISGNTLRKSLWTLLPAIDIDRLNIKLMFNLSISIAGNKVHNYFLNVLPEIHVKPRSQCHVDHIWHFKFLHIWFKCNPETNTFIQCMRTSRYYN